MAPRRNSNVFLTRDIFIFIICLMTVKAIGTLLFEDANTDNHRQHESRIRNDEKLAFSLADKSKECLIPKAKPMDANPVLIASYPGSGAKLTWKLIRAISGIMTSDDHDHNGLAKTNEAIGIKTHYPVPHVSNQQVFSPYAHINRSVLLLRYPIDALSSYHNFLYERSNNLQNHSVRAPSEQWIEWRNKYFDEKMKIWVDHIQFWMLYHTHENRLIISYEDLLSSSDGPGELLKLKNFLRVDNESILNTSDVDIPCIWDKLVDDSIYQGTKMASLRKSDSASERRPVTDDHLKKVKDELKTLRDLFPDELTPILNKYITRASV